MLLPRFGQGYEPEPITGSSANPTARSSFSPYVGATAGYSENRYWEYLWYSAQGWFSEGDRFRLNGSPSNLNSTTWQEPFLTRANGLPPVGTSALYKDDALRDFFRVNLLGGWGLPDIFCLEFSALRELRLLLATRATDYRVFSFSEKTYIKGGDTFTLRTFVSSFATGNTDRKVTWTVVPREDSRNLASSTGRLTSEKLGSMYEPVYDYYASNALTATLGEAGCVYITWGVTPIEEIQNAIISDLEYVSSPSYATVPRAAVTAGFESNSVTPLVPKLGQGYREAYPLNLSFFRNGLGKVPPLGLSREMREKPTLQNALTGLIGEGNFQGVTTENEVPIGYRKVRLYNLDTGQLLATTTSDADGFYSFSNLKPLMRFYVVSFDPTQTYNVVSELIPPLI